RRVSPGRCLQRRKAGRPASRTVDEVRVRDQSKNRKDAGPHHPRPFARAGRRGDRVRRREFITLLGGAAVAWPGVTRARGQLMPVSGYLRSGSRAASSKGGVAFRQGLSSWGFIEARNVAIDYQYAKNKNARLMALTADLLRQPVAVIYAGDNSTAVMVKSATPTIPGVFCLGGGPLQLRLATNPPPPTGANNRAS